MREKLVAIGGGGWAVGEFCPIFGEICVENVRFYNQIETHFVCLLLVSSICHVQRSNRCDHSSQSVDHVAGMSAAGYKIFRVMFL